MPNTWFPQRGFSRRLLNLVLASLLATATVVLIQGGPALAVDVPSVTNPAWPDKCGVDIVMVFDASNSIEGTDATLMKQAGTEFVDALTGSPSNVAVTWFRGIDSRGGDGVGGTQIPLTSVATSGTDVNAAINSIAFPGAGDDGGTNWEHGFNTTDPFPSADIILFMTDGNPTTFNGSQDLGIPPPDPEDVDAGVTEANNAKLAGARILAVGIGTEISTENLKRISGPTQGDDWYLASDFADLINKLPDIALKLCNGSVTVEKIADGAPAADWEFTATPDTASPSATQVTGTDGKATFTWKIFPGNPIDVTVTETLQDGFTFLDYSCTNEQTGQTLTAGFSLGQGDNVNCTFNNITTPDPQIAIEKTTNGADADTPTGPQVLVGDPVTWTYTVTNPGNVALSNVTVTDDRGVTPVYQGGDTDDNGQLDPGETWTYTANGTAVAGQYANTGTATADFEESPITDTDPSHYFGVDVSIDIEKATNGEDADTPTGPEVLVGDPVTWTYTVTNPGNVALSNVTVTDDQGVTPVYKSGDTNSNDILETTETWIYEATGTAVLGEYKNTGTATADYEEEPATDSDLSHYVGVLPPVGDPLVIDKLVDNLDGTWVDIATYPSDQTTVTWQITLANTAEGDVFKVTLTDAVAPSCEPALDAALTAKGWTNTDGGYLPGGESVTFECTEDLAAGAAVVNVAIANGVDQYDRAVPSVQDDATVQRVLANASIGDTVWADENENGVQDNGEKGIAGATVRLTLPDASVVETTTNSNGLYLFSALDAGTYTVEVVLSSIPKPSEGDLKLTTAGSFTIQLADEQSYLDADFGVVATLPKTGLDTGAILVIALALLLAGAVALLGTKRRKEDGNALA